MTVYNSDIVKTYMPIHNINEVSGHLGRLGTEWACLPVEGMLMVAEVYTCQLTVALCTLCRPMDSMQSQ